MGAVDGLRFHGGIPPGIEKHHVAGPRQVESGASRAQGDQEHAGLRIGLERGHRFLAALGRAREHVVTHSARIHLGRQQLEAFDELREEKHLVTLGQEWLEQLEEHVELSRPERVLSTRQRWMAADLAQAGEDAQDLHSMALHLLSCPEPGDQRAAALQLEQVELALTRAELAVTPLLDAIGQLHRHLALETSE